MNDYLIHLTSHYKNGRSVISETINANSMSEALQLFMQDFEYDLRESNLVDDTLSISITVKQK